MTRDLSGKLFAEACGLLPGGVSSPVRAFRAVGGDPVFFLRGRGAHLTDVDGNDYIDFVGSWGPLLLGHAHPEVVRAVQRAAAEGMTFGAPIPAELELARLVRDAFPSMDLLRFVSSGTEATMSAIRAARGFTGRSRILKFEGCYHGHADHLLVKAGSGAATLGAPDSAGVPEAFASQTLLAPYNDLEAVEGIFRVHGPTLAAVIVEPVAANMGVVPPAPGFLEGLRRLTRAHGTLLVFDEVISGFRVAWGGAQALYDVRPDLTCLGKILGGGLPMGAYGGRRDVMEVVSPVGTVYQAGTLSGNPVAVAAGLATLRELKKPGVYDALEARMKPFMEDLQAEAVEAGPPAHLQRVGSMFTVFFSDSPVTDFASAQNVDRAAYGRFFHQLLDEGVYFPPSALEAAFVSMAHGEADLERAVRLSREAFHLARTGG